MQRSIYGLIKASRSWNIRFDQAIKSFGFKQSIDEPWVCSQIKDGKMVFLILYINDILTIGKDINNPLEIEENRDEVLYGVWSI